MKPLTLMKGHHENERCRSMFFNLCGDDADCTKRRIVEMTTIEKAGIYAGLALIFFSVIIFLSYMDTPPMEQQVPAQAWDQHH